MSTWTNEKHEAAQELVRVVDGSPLVSSSLRTTVSVLADALDEIDRLRALPTITDDKVERLAAHQNDAHLTTWGFPWRKLSEDEKKAARAEARWALEAALNPGEGQ